MKKKFVFLLAFVMIVSLSIVPAFAAETSGELQSGFYCYEISDNNLSSPDRIIHSYLKTVTKQYPRISYPSLSDIPETIYYEEYNSGYGAWFHGYLDLQSVNVVGNVWYVTYSGYITGSI